MLPLRIARVAASKRLLPAVSTFSTSSLYRNKEPEVAQPHVPNRSSTLGPDVPKVGKANAPPEFLGKVDPNYTPKDAGSGAAKAGEVSGSRPSGHEINDTDFSSFFNEPVKRTNENEKTMRARLVYQSRKRGILETDLLLSTFADTHLSEMTIAQLSEYDKFLDENDWDIYYWCTQDAPADTTGTVMPASRNNETASPSHPAREKIASPPGAIGVGSIEQPAAYVGSAEQAQNSDGPQSGEWAQTVGTVKQPYRPVPQKWANSEILKRLRDHVDSRKAKGGEAGKGMGRMPDMKSY